ncbi:MAG: hypothetical protein KC731_02835 [Myxococcales bacterium]|nr:hypothetical protein [Myxococcales bacterium]
MSLGGSTAEVRLTPSIKVLVLEVHHGSLGIARSLGRQGVEVHGLDADPDNLAWPSRYWGGRHVFDLLGAGPERSLEHLRELSKTQLGAGTLLIPTSDEAALFVAKHADELAEHYTFARQKPELIEALTSKESNYRLAKDAGVPVPHTEFPKSLADVEAFCADATFPVMLKGISGRRLYERTGRRMLMVETVGELLRAYEEMEDPESPNLMLQEYIPGGDDSIWMFNGYFDADSVCRCAFTGRKLRQTPPHFGATSLGVCQPNDTVRDTTIQFMQDIGYTGILDIGYRYDARDGQYKLLDPNPRIGSTFRLFVGHDGMDVVRYLYMDKTGQPLPESRLRDGRRWFVEENDIFTFAAYRHEGILTPWEWIKSYRGVEESAWFALDDLAPFRHHAVGIAKRIARKLTGT